MQDQKGILQAGIIAVLVIIAGLLFSISRKLDNQNSAQNSAAAQPAVVQPAQPALAQAQPAATSAIIPAPAPVEPA